LLTDTVTLHHAIEATLKACTGKSIQVGLHWRMIQLDRAGRIPEDEAVHAIHIEVDHDHCNEAKLALQEIYSSKATERPLHLCMHAIPLLKDVLNDLIKKDIHWLIRRQASFNDEEFGKRKINTWEIKELDFESATSGKTLRDFILAILRQDNPSRKLFHSVDNLCTNRSTVVFTGMPAVESEACNMVSSLLTYLKQQHGDQVLELFTKNAHISAIDSYWDEKAQCVRNKDDAHVAGLLNDIDDDYILPPVHKDNQPSQNMPAPVRPQPITRHTPSSAIPLMMTMI
jgi:hypothetical protein